MPDEHSGRFTGRSLVTFNPDAKEEDYNAFWNEVMEGHSIDPSTKWFSPLFRIGYVPIPPKDISPRRAWRYGVERVEDERVFRSPAKVETAGVASHLDMLGISSATRYHGSNIRVAILDSGLDETLAEFTGRVGARKSFVNADPNDTDDVHGHGTHCTALACGPRVFSDGWPGGVADQASILVAQIANKYGFAEEGDVLRALEWADTERADVISLSYNAMSLDNAPSEAFERAGRVLLQRGRLFLASAGNGGEDGSGPVDHPANCNSVLAVGAIDRVSAPAPFSPSFVAAGDPVDLVAPGEKIRSLWCHPQKSKILSGTSQAAALAAGMAALWAEAKGSRCRGLELWATMIDNAVDIAPNQPRKLFRRVGFGCLNAP